MAPRTRNILIGSALVVAVGLGTGLVAYYSNALPGRAGVDSEFAYIPADVSAVAFADVRSIMDSEFRQKLRQVTPTGAEKNRLLEETGIDIERDIDAVVAGFNHNGPTGAVVVLRGRFDRARIEELAISRGADRQPYGGRVLLVGLAHQHDGAVSTSPEQGQPALAFLDDNLLALGQAAGVRRAIDAAASHNSMTANDELMALVSGVRGAGNAWVVGRADSVAAQPHMPEQVLSQIEGIEWLSVTANIDRDVRGLVRAEARDDERAQQLRALVAGAIAAVQMFGQQDAGMGAALRSLQAGGTGRSIELAFQISPELVDLLAKTAGEKVTLPEPH